MATYRTFKRSARSFEEFAKARKIPDEDGLTYSEARDRCEAFNMDRSPEEIERGTKLEFEDED